MADIKAFRAWRYDLDAAGAAHTLITPPYDVISANAQESYYAANPYNIIRLELGKVLLSDDDKHNRYHRAAADFAAWKMLSILKRDDTPCLYPYVQEFTLEGLTYRRGGFMATLKAGGYADGQVLPHEETLPGHKEDRYRLMQACMANFSPIFGLYAEEDRAIDTLLEQAVEGQAPIIDATDKSMVRHLVWQLRDNAVIEKVEAAFAPLKVYIADGHHRYETASRFAADMAAAKRMGCDRLLVHLANLYDPGVVALPTHRLVKNLQDFSAPAFLQALTDAGFAVFKINTLAALREYMADSRQGLASFGLYLQGQHYLLNIDREDMLIAAAQPGHSPAYQQLDVSIAHTLILDALCGLGQEELASGQYLSYCRDAADAVTQVNEGAYHFALLLNGTRMDDMLAVANAGEKMPQKSTYFYPKVIAGLLIHQLGE